MQSDVAEDVTLRARTVLACDLTFALDRDRNPDSDPDASTAEEVPLKSIPNAAPGGVPS